MTTIKSSVRSWVVLAIAIGLVLLGGGVAAWVQTGGGTVQVRDTSFVGTDGHIIAGRLYVPNGADVKHKVPAVLAVHGYINTNETQDAFAIELSRRGYAVLAIDQYGHGNSDPAAFYAGYGGPAALAYLRTFDFIDKDNIGLEGHSMGGWTVVSAAAAIPDGYKSMVLEGSSVGGGVAPDGTTKFPKNVKVVYGTWEQFSQLMWNVPSPSQMQSGQKLEKFFGTDTPVKAGTVYGSIADGTAREVVRPVTDHPGLTFDFDAVGQATDWFAKTLDGGHSAAGQIWWLKEAGTFVAFLGGILSIFAVGALLLRTRFFASLRQAVPVSTGARFRGAWWVGAILTAGIPALTFYWFNNFGAQYVPASALFPQNLTSGIMIWALFNGLIGLAILVVTHLVTRKRTQKSVREYGFTTTEGFRWSAVGKSALVAIASVGFAYLLLVMSDWLFDTDFRLYILQLHILNGTHFVMFLVYLLPFTVFFLMLAASLHNTGRWTGMRGGRRREMVANAIVLPIGILVMILVDMIPLMAGGSLLSGQSLLVIVAYPFVPVLAIVGLLMTYFFHKTGMVYVGAFIAALLVTWNIVGGQAEQFDFTEWGGIQQFFRVILPVIVGLVFIVGALVWRSRARRAGTYLGDAEPAREEAVSR
ncbi:alpha/beta fold hydrolase [Pseudolysinimonas sp.]|uniref:alpha/beta fold hydrolase n=1 Tax=Pseudolysinimonas sp. TaxID=2680009 RepID=UPI003F8147A9